MIEGDVVANGGNLYMKKQKKLIRAGFFAIIIFSIILCSFTTGMTRPRALGTPFQTVPPVNATLATPIGALTPVPTPIPTLGPGQYFEEGDHPEITKKYGDDKFGWGDIEGKPDLALIWVTDEDGTHYMVVNKSSDAFAGYRLRDENGNPTNDRLEDGFIHLIQELADKEQDIFEIETKINDKQSLRAGADTGAVLIVIAGVVVCGVMTGGACFAAFAVPALGGVGVAVGANTSAHDLEDQRAELEAERSTIEGNLFVSFNDAIFENTNP